MGVIEIKIGYNKIEHREYILGELYRFKHKTADCYLLTIFNGYSRIDNGGLFYVKKATSLESIYNIKDFFKDDISLVYHLDHLDHLDPLDVIEKYREERENKLEQVKLKFIGFERERILNELIK